MKKLVVLLIALGSTLSCYSQQDEFTGEALQDIFVDMEGNDILFASVLEKHKGKPVFIDVWASWCGDCVKGMPGVKKLMSEYTEVQFLFLSLDRTQDRWKRGIERFGIEGGDHYFIKAGWKESTFCSAIKLDWIPRYMVIDSNGKIIVFKAIKTNDQNLINTLKTLQ